MLPQIFFLPKDLAMIFPTFSDKFIPFFLAPGLSYDRPKFSDKFTPFFF